MAKPVLAVYLLPDCPGCERAHWIAGEVKRRCPDVQVRVIDLSEPAAIRPSNVFSVPTYLLDGQVISLGNPDLDRLVVTLIGQPGEAYGHHNL
jgi:predicted thioredoxin/glutaredoxin